MTDTRFDVLGIGNAIVDVISRTTDDFLVREGLVKGSMRLIDAEEAERLYEHMGPTKEVSGGSAGNTIAALAGLGGKAAYFGKVSDDHLGKAFAHDIRAVGVHFETAPLMRIAPDHAPTARSMILVTPDGERTMNTFLGACTHLTPADIDVETVAASKIVYLEGYLWDPPAAKEAFREASRIAHAHDRRVALTLSDSFCVERWRPEFLELMRGGFVDVVFANQAEVKALYETADIDAGVAALRADVGLAAVTLSEEGSLVASRDGVVRVAAAPAAAVVDTTGAGDLYAAGFLYGLTHGFDHATCAELGGLLAAEIIGHIGARSQSDLADLVRQAGFPV
ncbi:adenosine kinase [Pinisolibacter aquiterrae]|uniref:adenosine kinase n=1 Tax=Pinisolibacter aquiterrae TaxID=2815579 RepID=UPI001C3CC758|nr:adenosine kinase [Pinisolibacter aquiterrae]MBV5262868.1 adenosine kinase [Pinisolibacter aquiterrae]MCC8236418.1 adenosine kinase [Pinisolibacter aquiterrae]